MNPEVQQVRALGLVSSRKSLLTWSSQNGEDPPREGKWVVDSDSSEAEEPSEESEQTLDSKISHQMEELDYLALDLVTVLPGERVHRLLDTLRQQDGIMHDLLGRAKTLYKENKILKQKQTHASKKMPVWALPLPGETASREGHPGSDAEQFVAKKLRKSRSAVANLISNRSHKETFAEKHKSGRVETRFLDRLEWALKNVQGSDGAPMVLPTAEDAHQTSEKKTKSDLCATASSRSTSASADEEQKIEALQATVRELTERNKELSQTNQRLQAEWQITLGELAVKSDALKKATDEIHRLKTPRTYNLRLTPAKYRPGAPGTSPVSPTSPSVVTSPSAEALPRFESSPGNRSHLDTTASSPMNQTPTRSSSLSNQTSRGSLEALARAALPS